MTSESQETSIGYGGLEQPSAYEGSTEGIKERYKKWALNYDKDTNAHGYVAADRFVEQLVAVFQKNGITKDLSIMDVGAGTGLVAERLKEHGYENIDGLDVTPEMLEVAKMKNVYKKLRIENLETGLASLKDDIYDVVTAVGTFSCGLVKPGGLDAVVRITKPGGLMAFTVRGDAFKNSSLGYSDKIEEMTRLQVWTELEKCVIDYDLQYTNPDARWGWFFCFKKNIQ